ncbi:hypothetical protein Cantr_02008 [Candida viswanathii]|uniref:Uncharacterized protein n=1 Tax=Candida viswanathii TaxID=5486 RepID=A0A367YKJ7_9ASCO|nr:hypothetical protein Cantr_02008 [Candida viswanathii]
MSEINKSWKSLYAYDVGKIYLHLKNNELVSLDFSIVNKNMTNYSTNQQVTPLSTPPANSTLFLLNDELYALTSQYDDNDSKDLCGDGHVDIVKYSLDDDSWDAESVVDLDFGDVSDSSFYQYQTILTNPNYNSTIYVYGGECNGVISNRLISLDFDTGKVSNISTSTKPQAFYGASNILAPIPQNQLIIGGELNQGWLNMYQLATWDFSSGWSFKQVKQMANHDVVNSRIFPLVLPIFKPVDNITTVNDELNIEQVLMIGGETADDDDQDISPNFAKLSMLSNDWVWNTTQTEYNLSYDDIIGAATIFNTLIVINSTDIGKRDSDGGYRLNLYDAETFKPVETLRENTQSIVLNSNTDSGSTEEHATEKIVLGTVLPVAAIVVGVFVFLFLRRRRKQRQLEEEQQQYNDIDYKYGYLPEPDPVPRPLYHQLNDSSSTLGGASIDSWMKKRQDYDKRKLRNSYLASNETLNTVDDEETGSSQYNDEDHHHHHDQPGEQDLAHHQAVLLPQTKPTTQHRPMKNLKKQFSFTKSPPTSPVGKFKRYQSKRAASSEHLIAEDSPDGGDNQEGIHSDATSLDDQMDVQVLVSSKRRSILRVVNPDLKEEDDEDEEQEKQSIIREDDEGEYDLSQVINQHFERIADGSDGSSSNNSLRQRVPSGQIDI